MTRIRTRIWLWLLVTALTAHRNAATREPRKEHNHMPVPIGVNLLGDSGYTQNSHGHQENGDRGRSKSHSPNADINIDYDYFMFGVNKAGSPETMLHRPSAEQPPPSIKQESKSPFSDFLNQDYSFFDYVDDVDLYSPSPVKDTRKGNDKQDQVEKAPVHDPFSVFYDSLFSVVDEEDEAEVAKSPIVESSPYSGPPNLHSISTPSTSTLTTTAPNYHTLPTVAVKIPLSTAAERPIPSAPTRTVPHPTYSPKRNHSALPQRQKIILVKPKPHPVHPPKTYPPKIPSFNESKPMDLTHLKVLMPKLLEKFGLPQSFADKLFQNEAVLQETLLQIMRDKTFREALSMIPKLNLLNMDMKSILSTLSTIDPSLVVSVLKNADLSRVMSLMSNLGIDTSYITGVFNRAGAAAEYSPQSGGEDDSKLIYIPILDTGSVNNVQILGFIVIMFFLLATAYAYLEYGFFTAVGRKDGPLRPAEPAYTSEQILDWGQTSGVWLPAVEATEAERPWNPPPPIHMMGPGHHETQRPYRQHEVQTPRPYIQHEPPTHRPYVRTEVHTQRPYVQPEVQTRRPYRPPSRRPRPPKIRRRYYQRYRPEKQSHMFLDSQEIRRLTRRRPVYRRPAGDNDRSYYVDDDYYDSEYYYDDDYYYLDDYETHSDDDDDDDLSHSSRSGSYRDYYRTPRPYDHPYSYYSFQGALTDDKTHSPTTIRTTTESTTPSTTTITQPTRPTSRYADRISSGKPNFTSNT